jgi:hypothetical protein
LNPGECVMKPKITAGLIVIVAVLAVSCAPSGPPAEQVAETLLAETAAAQASAVTPAIPSTPTITPTLTITPKPPTPTATPVPTATPGPFILADDLTKMTDRWSKCDYCTWGSNGLQMGPFPESMANRAQILYCETCGQVRNFRMAVDATFGEGPSERGYGFVYRATERGLSTAEITPWQTVYTWGLDVEAHQWRIGQQRWTASVKPGTLTNHLDLAVTSYNPGRVLVTVKVNGRTPIVYEGLDETGWVGLYLYGHGTSVTFSNFSFEELEPLGSRITD